MQAGPGKNRFKDIEGFSAYLCGMTASQAVLLFLAGILAGGLNALAGGGGFVTFPALLGSGVQPILANTSGTIAVWPGLMASLFAYRKNLQGKRHPLLRYLVLAVAGSLVGAFLLLFTTNSFFMALLPFLLLFATLLFIFGKDLTTRISALQNRGASTPGAYRHGNPWAPVSVFVIAVYGGYFGGGMGIITLALLTLLGMEDIHEMNALKSLLVVVINGACVAAFIIGGKVAWPECLVMTGGCAIGGYGAGRLVLKAEPTLIRRGIAILAVGMTLYFFFRVYGPR